MNKLELAEKVASVINASKAEVERMLNATFQTITEALQQGEQVALLGFGAFVVRERAARVGRNPKTGAAIEIKKAKVPAFKAGKNLKDAVQDK